MTIEDSETLNSEPTARATGIGFSSAVQAVVDSCDPVIEQLDENLAILRKTGVIESYVVVIRQGAGAKKALEHFVRGKFAHAREILLVGGDSETAIASLKKLKPWYTTSKVGLAHIDDDGHTWVSRAGTIAKALKNEASSKALSEPLSPAKWTALVARAGQSVRETVDRQDEVRSFQETLQQRRPIITWTILAIIGVVFGLEVLWGGYSSTPVLTRMGAHVSTRMVDDNEWWRALSVTLLHGNVPHILFNGYMLYVLGSFIERIVGPSRFLVLYVLAGLGASAATYFFGLAPLSVGASGALWGILVAQAILAWFGRGVLPEAMLAPGRRVGAFNIIANVVFSFSIPGIDWAAHLGGGLVGAVLIGTGILTVGLPRSTDEREQGTRTPTWIRAAAAVSVAAFVVCGVLGLTVNRPWELTDHRMRTEAIEDVGITLEVPVAVHRIKRLPKEQAGVHLRFGESVLLDPVFGDILLDSVDDAETKASREAFLVAQTKILEEFSAPNMEAQGPAARVSLPNGIGLTKTWVFPSGAIITKATLLRAQSVVSTELFAWPELTSLTALEVARTVKVTDFDRLKAATRPAPARPATPNATTPAPPASAPTDGGSPPAP